MHRGFFLLQGGSFRLSRLGYYGTILRLDFVARRIAIDALMRFVGLRIRHGRGNRGIAVRFEFALHIFNELPIGFGG